jgi:flagellar biosynthesis protein FlhB
MTFLSPRHRRHRKALQHPKLRHIRPLWLLNHQNLYIAFFFEAFFTVIIIMLTLILDEWLKDHIPHKMYRYLIESLVIFLTTLCLLFTLLYLFGYGQNLILMD